MMDVNIVLSSWIVQDGNYSNFKTGHEYIFALQVISLSNELTSNRVTSLSREDEIWYKYSGHVISSEKKFTVLDVGIKCFISEYTNNPFVKGPWIKGNLIFGVDPFFWSEDHSKSPNAPKITYRWQVEKIQLETTAWDKSKDISGATFYKRAKVQPSYREVAQTNAGKDDGYFARYVLKCSLLGLAP